MFNKCFKLSGLPDGFSAPKATNASGMFYNCTSLLSLPDGFSTPNAVSANDMFNNCSSLSALPVGFSAPKATNTKRHVLRLLQALWAAGRLQRPKGDEH